MGEAKISFEIDNDFDEKVIVISILTFLGHSTTPVVSQFSASVLTQDNYEVDFFYESQEFLVPDVNNKMYFQVYNKEAEKMPIEFTKAQLIDMKDTVVVDEIKHLHNGRSSFEFQPNQALSYKLRITREFA